MMAVSGSAKRSVAIVIRDRANRVLVVKRADDDPAFPGAWGLPASSRRNGETEQEAAIRTGRDKLGVGIKITGFVGKEAIDSGGHSSDLSEYEVQIDEGTPFVPQPDRSVSQYVDLRYTDDLSILFAAARQGSLCSRILLDSLGVDWRPR